jgi:cellobiose-specific phosphotransferase system component IIA
MLKPCFAALLTSPKLDSEWLIYTSTFAEGKTMSHVSPVFANSVNQITNSGMSRAEATEVVRNALNEFQNQASEPLISLLTNSGGSSGGWLEALAKALGDKLDQAANTLKNNANAVSADSPGQTTQLSAEAEEFAQMMDAFNNVIKTLGQAMDTMVQKQ